MWEREQFQGFVEFSRCLWWTQFWNKSTAASIAAKNFLLCAQVEQLHKIFKLCGSPSEEYWKKSKLPHATIFKPQQSYKRCIAETFKDFPASSLPLIEILLAIDPAERQTATAALRSEVSFYIQLSDCLAPHQALIFFLQYRALYGYILFSICLFQTKILLEWYF